MANCGKAAQKSVKKELGHRKHGKRGGMSRNQAVVIGLSKARRKGATVPKRKHGGKGGRSRGTKK